jgi:hypothetical protein
MDWTPEARFGQPIVVRQVMLTEKAWHAAAERAGMAGVVQQRMVEHLRLSRSRRRPVVHAERHGADYGHAARREPTERGRPRRACRRARRLQEAIPRFLHRASLAATPRAGKALRNA